jgi:hypothetical protein
MLLRADLGMDSLSALLERYGARLIDVGADARLPGSYWGAPEAGLVGRHVYVRADTPAHSLLHELGHYVCMSTARRTVLWRDAGGDEAEECAVCYLQVLLADYLANFGRERCFADMDAWGYSFRQGSARAWFDGDGADARAWLRGHGLIDHAAQPTWRLRADYNFVGFGASP